MPKLELVKADIDSTKVYHPQDNFLFKLTFNNQEYLDEDVEFEVIHYGDAWTEDHDQKLCHNVIGPLDAGKLYFELDAAPIDLTKVPIKTLFGLTSLLIVGKFRGAQFIRIGYVVDVRYPGIEPEKLADSEDGAEDECEGSEEVSGDEDEVSGDESLVSDGTGNDANSGSGSEEEDGSEEVEVADDGEVELHDALAESIFPSAAHRSIPLETPITADKDEFEYKGYSMKKSLIEMTLLDKPIVHVFEIDWETNKGGDVAESTESQDNEEKGVSTDANAKKIKTQ